MNKLTQLLTAILSITFLSAFAQSNIDFIKKNATEIAIDINSEEYNDFKKLIERIKDARIVLLGEESHGDGTTFETKARLIKFLHEKLGFKVLAFESSLYNAERAWKVAHWDKDPVKAIQNSTFELWGQTQQFLPLANYIANSIKTPNPLRVTGFDPQLHGTYLRRDLPVDFLMFLKARNIAFKDMAEQDTFYRVYNALSFELKKNNTIDQEVKSQIIQRLPSFKRILDRKIADISNLKQDSVSNFWKQFWISTSAYLPAILEEKGLDSPNTLSKSIRDSLMAENLIWIAKSQYPTDKIIVWAASIHIGKTYIEENGKQKDVTAPFMGDFLKDKLADKYYSICFTAYEGEVAWYNNPTASKIDKPSTNSFETLFEQAGFKNAFLDLKSLSKTKKGKWLNEPRSMRPYGYYPLERRWPQIFDAVIFNKQMTRALPVRQ
ncbi:erythromycin esterase family protein [Pedobacter rhodius]|uniref:Erythromycin esterase family protein n=1 Tax=Pedobacter rhodius TaxID=3004098 RepID=A0ABT4KWD5_9SPHI|nr:erythromycin esterase family protein [Pedobacter sp. SJ11]MCZ4223248.1 erythromycin esterase family protein [Pedobacter sp. SJ11]